MRYFLFITAIIAFLFVFNPQTPVFAESAQQTIPTRTPTPEPIIPPTTPPQQPPAPTQPPTAVATTIVLPTHTAVSLMPTPQGGFLPTAVACDTQPTLQAVNQIDFTNVRQGPGTDYAVTAQLVANEVRPIIGRAADAPWWVIALNDDEYGWVADDVVTVQGDISQLPLVDAPLLNGATATPGAPWQPTPTAVCATTSPERPTATATTPATATAVAEIALGAVATSTTPQVEGLVDVKDLAPVTPTATATAIVLASAAAPLAANPSAETTTAVADAPTRSVSPLLAVGAGLLLVGGMAIVIFKRR